jgi:hypothetical protein
MNELGRFTACPTGKVRFLHKRDLIATRHGIDCDPGARDAASDDQNVKTLLVKKREVVSARCGC